MGGPAFVCKNSESKKSIGFKLLNYFMQVFATAKTCYRGVRQSPSPLRLREHTRNLNARF